MRLHLTRRTRSYALSRLSAPAHENRGWATLRLAVTVTWERLHQCRAQLTSHMATFLICEGWSAQVSPMNESRHMMRGRVLCRRAW